MEVVSYNPDETTEAEDGVHLQQLAAGEEMSVQHWAVEPDKRVPKHKHHHEQTGYILEGTAVFLVGEEEEEVIAEPGDSYAIPSDTYHAVENRGDTPIKGLDIFSPPRGNPDWLKKD